MNNMARPNYTFQNYCCICNVKYPKFVVKCLNPWCHKTLRMKTKDAQLRKHHYENGDYHSDEPQLIINISILKRLKLK